MKEFSSSTRVKICGIRDRPMLWQQLRPVLILSGWSLLPVNDR